MQTSHAILEKNSRIKKAKKIISVIENFSDLEFSSVLDIGTGSGHIINIISQECKSATSVDVKDERIVKSNYLFKKINNENLPFDDNSFDIVISNHVIEHVPSQKLHISEIHRVLKEDGILYLATPNKFWFTDPHYKLFFISWLPRKISNFYLKLFFGKEWDIYPLSFNSLKKLTKNKFTLKNVTIDIIKNPKQYNLDVLEKLIFITKFIPVWIIRFFNFIIPTYILILKKTKQVDKKQKIHQFFR